MRYTFILALLFFYNGVVEAQSFLGEAALKPVAENGFYRIMVTPELGAYLNQDFTNLRIYDQGAKEVPFLFQTETPNQVTQNFREYIILEKKQVKGCCTSLLLHNPDQRLLNNINLVIRNADVTKEGSLLGSDDKEHWFALKQHLFLDAVVNEKGTSEIKIVDFPLSSYSYYALNINDSTSDPLNIQTAGYFEVQTEYGKYGDVPIERITASENLKEKRTLVTIKFDTARTVDKLEISMKGAPYFLRRAALYEPLVRTLKKGKKEHFNDFIQEVEINSRRATQLELSAMKTKALLLIIENDDNPPLEIASVKASQLNRYFTAWLEKDKSYTIKITGAEHQRAVYDLSFFKDSIPEEPQVITAEKVKIFDVAGVQPSTTFFTTKAYIWGAVIFVIVVLGFMSLKLLKENAASSGSDTKIDQ